MKAIHTHAAHLEATKTLNDLSAALESAKTEETRLLAALARTPGASGNPLQAALNLLAGKEPERTDNTGLNQALDAVRARIATLTPGLEQQRATLKDLTADLSAAACADAAVAHGKAAQGIADALEGLRTAMAAESAVRAAIVTAGYRCTLPAMVVPGIDFDDAQSIANRYLHECRDYATDTQDAASGALDKPATVHLLTGTEHGQPGDVVSLPGRVARLLQRMGRAEPSRDKPRKAPQQAGAPRELILE